MKPFFIFSMIAFLFSQTISGQDAAHIVQKSYEKMRGKSSFAKMVMKVVRPGWERTIKFKSWSSGTEYSLVLITYPAREKGKTFLKRGDEMWSWHPAIDRLIKLPPSMMANGWMGSDYTNNDLINDASIVNDYNHKLLGTDSIREFICHRVELIPKEDAAIIWGKIVMWVGKEEFYELKTQFFDEDGDLIKTHLSSDIKHMDDRLVPSKFEIIPEKEEDQRTIINIKEMDFDVQLRKSFFSHQQMKNIR